MSELFDLHRKYDSVKTREKYPYSYVYTKVIYPKYFEPIRHTADKILEIGTSRGNAMRAMRDYFTKAEIYGVDIIDIKKRILEEPRINYMKGNQADEEFMSKVIAQGPFDIIIDDAGHVPAEQETCMKIAFKGLKINGWYFIEDLLPHFDGETTRRFVLSNYADHEIANYDTIIGVKRLF